MATTTIWTWRSASELVGHDVAPSHPTTPRQVPSDLSCTRSNDHLLPPPRPTRQSYAPVRTINWKALTATKLASNKHPESCFQHHFTTGDLKNLILLIRNSPSPAKFPSDLVTFHKFWNGNPSHLNESTPLKKWWVGSWKLLPSNFKMVRIF